MAHSGLATGQVIHGSAPVRDVIARCAALPMPAEDPGISGDCLRFPGGAGNVSRGEALRRGVGFAVGWKNLAYSEGFDDSSEAKVRLVAEVGMGHAGIVMGLEVSRLARNSTDWQWYIRT